MSVLNLVPVLAGAGLLLFSCKPSSEDSAIVPTTKNPDQYSYSYSTLTGGKAGLVDGKLADALFNKPGALAIDSKDNLYLVDQGNYAIRVISPDGTVNTLKNNLGKKLDINYSTKGAVIGKDGTLYLAEGTSVAKVTKDGVKTTLSGTTIGLEPGGYKDGKGENARFRTLNGIAFYGDELLVTDTDNQVIRKVTLDGTVTTFAGIANKNGFQEGPVDKATFYYPAGIGLDSKKNVYISQHFGNDIRKISTDGKVQRFTGNGVGGYNDGDSKNASFNSPIGLFVTPAGFLLVADVINSSIRLVSPTGDVTTLYKGKKGLDALDDVVMDSKGNIYFTEPGTNSIGKLTAK
ncbi:hypothetical protein [Larkinella rosea]|uniref:SMP-30/Gluconolactonase/LRE-like region domain-containing protein n=1 Tax=Larkinella rosea TaxID=2025312 RepID=A0A3P1BS47_9BACT|nr:hypothetical protein [Larkinella rosea]RRB03921.1 hypothetical protein EHT25_10325 [Larkinella rosea]